MALGYLNSEVVKSRQDDAISGEQYFLGRRGRWWGAGSVAFVALLRWLLFLGVLAGVGRE
jgi:hypothetical protein